MHFMVRAFHTTLQGVKKAAFMSVLSHLSCCGQQRISIDVVGKIAKPYLCPGPDNTDRSDNQVAGHHHHHPKDMLNPGAYLRPRLIALLLPRGDPAVSSALALQPFTKSPLLQQLDRLLRPISGIGVCLSTCVGFLQKLSKHPAVMYRRIRHRVSAALAKDSMNRNS